MFPNVVLAGNKISFLLPVNISVVTVIQL